MPQTIPTQIHSPRRRRGLAAACALAVLASSGHNRDDDDQNDSNVDGGGHHDKLPSSWSPYFFLAASAAPAPNNQQQPHSNDIDDDSALPLRPPNHYELLGLESPDSNRRRRTGALLNRKKRSSRRSKILTSDIKKAYRKQAQLYHPDKASRRNMTTEEATTKFAEIAEAYSVLSNHAQRYEYDWELLDEEEELEEERLIMEEERRENKRNDRQQRRQQQQYSGGEGEDFSLYDKIRNGASDFQTWKETLNLDPWAVFEDFFFQDSAMGGDSFSAEDANADDYHRYYHQEQHSDAYDNYYRSPYETNQQQRQSHHGHFSQTPPRVSETTVQRGYDPAFGAEVYTVLRREEYLQDINQNGEYYHRILGQDFISGTRVDPYTGFATQEYYSAVTEPYFVEEGYTSTSRGGENGSNHHAGKADSYYDEHRQQNQEQSHESETEKIRTSPSELAEGESFTPTGSEPDPWVSPNGKYRAILTSTCELQIVNLDDQHRHEDDGFADDNVVWTSETYIPDMRARGCHLALSSMGSLVLSVDYGSGIDSVGMNTVLWSTPLPPVVPHWFHDDDTDQRPVTFRYHASLDNDGVIAIYRFRERVSGGADAGSTDNEERDNNGSNGEDEPSRSDRLQVRGMIDRLGGIYQRMSNASIKHGQTRAALAWDRLRHNMGRVFLGRPWIAFSVTNNDKGQQRADDPSDTVHECVYSTSPVGCLAPGRNAIHLTKKIARTLKRSVHLMDSQLDQFFSALTEPVESSDYDDYGSDGGYGFVDGLDDEDDEDVLDTLLRVTGAAGAQLGKAGMHGIHAARAGMTRSKNVAGRAMGKMKDRMGSRYVRSWGERMMSAEEDEVGDFF